MNNMNREPQPDVCQIIITKKGENCPNFLELKKNIEM